MFSLSFTFVLNLCRFARSLFPGLQTILYNLIHSRTQWHDGVIGVYGSLEKRMRGCVVGSIL